MSVRAVPTAPHRITFEAAGRMRRSVALLALASFVLPLAVYWRTAFPSVHLWDAAEFQTAVPSLGIVHSPGYPTYLLLARAALILPHDEPARFLNLLSGAAAAATVAGLALLLHRLTGSGTAALGAALFFAFTHYQWNEARFATPYTLNTLWLVADLWLIQAWRAARRPGPLLAFGVLFGLQPGVHMSSVLQAPNFAVQLLATDRGWFRPPRLLALAACVGLGLTIWLYLPLRALAEPPVQWARLVGYDLTNPRDLYLYVSSDLFKDWMFAVPPERLGQAVAEAFGWLWRNELGLGVPVGLLGWSAQLRRDRPLGVGLSIGYLLHLGLYSTYTAPNLQEMFLPGYLIWAIWVGEGLGCLLARAAGDRQRVLRSLVCLLPLLPLAANFGRLDAGQNRVARALAESALEAAAPGSVILAPWVAVTTLQYLTIVEGRRPDVELFDTSEQLMSVKRRLRAAGESTVPDLTRRATAELNAIIADRLAAGRTVYLLDDSAPEWAEWELSRAGPLYRVQRRG